MSSKEELLRANLAAIMRKSFDSCNVLVKASVAAMSIPISMNNTFIYKDDKSSTVEDENDINTEHNLPITIFETIIEDSEEERLQALSSTTSLSSLSSSILSSLINLQYSSINTLTDIIFENSNLIETEMSHLNDCLEIKETKTQDVVFSTSIESPLNFVEINKCLNVKKPAPIVQITIDEYSDEELSWLNFIYFLF